MVPGRRHSRLQAKSLRQLAERTFQIPTTFLVVNKKEKAFAGLSFYVKISCYLWARGSVVERCSDKAKVDGSIPSAPTSRALLWLGEIIKLNRLLLDFKGANATQGWNAKSDCEKWR